MKWFHPTCLKCGARIPQYFPSSSRHSAETRRRMEKDNDRLICYKCENEQKGDSAESEKKGGG